MRKNMSDKLLFNDHWEFMKQNIGFNIQSMIGNDATWEKVDLPHDWVIYDTSYFQESKEGWYRKRFTINLEDSMNDNVSSKRYIIRFEGIYMDSTV